jgi:hypothetical protein
MSPTGASATRRCSLPRGALSIAVRCDTGFRSSAVRSLPFLAALFTLAGCGGQIREFPRWRFTGPAEVDAGCALGRAFIRMSGKTGVGVNIQLRTRGDCRVRLARAELVLDGVRAPATLPEPILLRGRSLVYVWVPFEFDNEAAWNAGRRDGTFEIDVEAGGTITTWRIPADHRREHRYVPGSDPWAR